MKYTTEQLIEAVPHCTSIRQLLIKLGIAAKGGNHKTIKLKLEKLGIDTSHFTGQGHNKGKKLPHKVTHASQYLSYGTAVTSYRLKNALIRDGYFSHECSGCHLTEWLENLIPLELDHINGDNIDNRLENLRLLCPNCHALTPTYRGKNQKRARSSNS